MDQNQPTTAFRNRTNSALRAMTGTFLVIALLTSLAHSSRAQQIPSSQSVSIEIDGFLDEEEWKQPQKVTCGPQHQLLLLQDEQHLYIGIKGDEKEFARYVDLYLETRTMGMINLHASMQLGERLLTENWNDTIPQWNWGNNTNWEANTVQVISDDENIPFIESLKPYEGFEFRISKKKLGEETVRIRIEIKDFLGQTDGVVYPSASLRNETDQWLQLDLK